LSIFARRAELRKMAKEIFSKDPEKFIPALADALKKIPEFKEPEWAFFVKSGSSRERPPKEHDFWHTRAASILRQIYIKGVVGVGKLRSRYGSRKDRGGKPDKFRKSGGKIIRVILQQAEAAGLVEKVNRMQHGRRLTQTGRDFLDSIDVPKKLGLNFEEMTVSVNVSTAPVEESKENLDEEAVGEQIPKEDIVEENTDAPSGVPPESVRISKEHKTSSRPKDVGGKELVESKKGDEELAEEKLNESEKGAPSGVPQMEE